MKCYEDIFYGNGLLVWCVSYFLICWWCRLMEWFMIMMISSVLERVLDIWFGIFVICKFCCKYFINKIVMVVLIMELELL